MTGRPRSAPEAGPKAGSNGAGDLSTGASAGGAVAGGHIAARRPATAVAALARGAAAGERRASGGGQASAAASPPLPGGGGLVARNAPPLRLPAEHFAAALVFWLLGAAGLIWVAPTLAQGAYAHPHVVAVTHLFTLGWITTTIMGALYQFLPVALGVPIRSERLAHLTFGLYAPGLPLFVGGMLMGWQDVMLAGAALFGTGLVFFAANLIATLRHAAGRGLTWWSLAGATVSLVATVVLGIVLAVNLRTGFLGADRFGTLGMHMHVAVAGWVMLVIVGVAHRLLPMFLLSHGASEWPGRIAAGMLGGGVATLLALGPTRHPIAIGVIAVLLGGGTVAFLAQAGLYFRSGRKPALDPGLRLVAVALGSMGLTVALAPFFLASGVDAPRIATAYGLALVGAPALFVAGHHYKIIPFLTWFHVYGPQVGKRPVPRVTDLYHARPANAAVALLGIGLVALVAVTIAGEVALARPAAALLGGGAAIVAAQMFTISRAKPL